MISLTRRPRKTDADLAMIAAYEGAIVSYAEERITPATSADEAQRIRDEAATLAATIGERLRAARPQRQAR